MAAERGPLETRDRLGLEMRDLNHLETPVAAERYLQPETRDRLELKRLWLQNGDRWKRVTG